MLVVTFLVSAAFSVTFAGGGQLCQNGDKISHGYGNYLKCVNGNWSATPCPNSTIFDNTTKTCEPLLQHLTQRVRRGSTDPNKLVFNSQDVIKRIVFNLGQTAPPTPLQVPDKPKPKPKKPVTIFKSECGYIYRKRTIGDKIAQGQNTRIETSPWQIAIMNVNSKQLRCGGSVISQYHVLTAAHCYLKQEGGRTIQVSKDLTYIFAGQTSLKEDGLIYNISHLYRHDEYSFETKANDIALLRILGEFLFSDAIQPICLPYPEVYSPERTCYVSGWGAYSTTSNTVDILKIASLKVTNVEYCKRRNKEFVTITDNMLCASESLNETDVDDGKLHADTCEGDSGGPLFVNEGGRRYLLGITSFGIGCAYANYPGVYTKVIKYDRWIRTTAETSMTDVIGTDIRK